MNLKTIYSIAAVAGTALVIAYAYVAVPRHTESLLNAPQAATKVATSTSAGTKTAMFAGGCFWSTQAGIEDVPGVIRAVSGY